MGEDAFKHAPAVIKEIRAYLKNLFDERELAGGMMLQLMQDVNTMSLDKFQADILATRAQYERSGSILVEWEWDGLHPSCQRVTRGPPGI